ncbi:glutamate racemase [Limosilactobacillus sp. STM2_1]|uniref:Glutamate racemase n=1 Tax=Limosilactobacillus rudii TaxID=2759755 RepID=A0A7W3ULS2_9LACO|nr:glutamate racemase [Limosilactobacillus rudii]MBB1079855.1 glutamate racemase [Limosilactobacillus rudii]MBB1097933.1 glutamate racemase [Limosilactobacillus rudii]MCD7135002.1 glutamate racemase [Limosilactobacillus rudii]
MDKRPIGVMDSGLGGLSVTRVLRDQLPNESIVFVGDQGHFPYGIKTRKEIQQLSLKIGNFLLTHDIKLMVIACNTATAAALQLLQEKLPVPVIGVIKPGAAAVAKHGYQVVGVIGTESTIKNNAYKKALDKVDPTLKVISHSTQPLVSIVEHGQTGTTIAQKTVNKELSVFDNQPIQALILGCTHFPFLEKEIAQKLGQDVQLIDPAYETVRQVKEFLTNQRLLSDDASPRIELYSTGEVEDLVDGAQKWLPNGYTKCEHIQLDMEDQR